MIQIRRWWVGLVVEVVLGSDGGGDAWWVAMVVGRFGGGEDDLSLPSGPPAFVSASGTAGVAAGAGDVFSLALRALASRTSSCSAISVFSLPSGPPAFVSASGTADVAAGAGDVFLLALRALHQLPLAQPFQYVRSSQGIHGLPKV
ncbi:hypothetical protein Tco_0724676 [Tanacetum coccineum]